MDKSALKRMLEAVIFAANEAVPVDKLRQTLPEEWELTNKELKAILAEMLSDYQQQSFRLIETASGYRFQIREEYAELVVKLMDDKPPRYSRALLETLVIIAYRQPVTRAEIENVRGVAVSSSIIKTLLEREWIRIIGHRDVPGRPSIVGTTKTFLDYFNLKSLDELPPLEEIKDLEQMAKGLEQQLPLNLEYNEQKNTETKQQTEITAESEQQEQTELVAESIDAEPDEFIPDSDFEKQSEVITDNGCEKQAEPIADRDFEEQVEPIADSDLAEQAEFITDGDFEKQDEYFTGSNSETEATSIAATQVDSVDSEAQSLTDPEPA